MPQANPTMLLVGISKEFEGTLSESLKGMEVQRAAADLRAVSEAASRTRPSAAMIDLPDAAAAEVPLKLVAHLAQAGARVIVLGPSKDPELILKAMRAGAQEFVVRGEAHELAQALRVGARALAEPAGGATLAVFGAKGGIGTSSIAINLAGALALRGHRTCLVDLDADFGDVLAMLDLAGRFGLGELRENVHRLDRELLDASVARHSSGLFVLGQPSSSVGDAARLDPKELAGLLGFLRRHYRFVVLDGLRGLDDLSVAALDAADPIALLVTQEVATVRNAQKVHALFRRLGYEDGRLRLVVNRYLRSSRITLPLMAETIGLRVAGTLANDFQAVTTAIRRGRLLREHAPRSELARDLETLATELGGAPEAKAPERPFWSRLFRSRGTS